MLVRFTLMTLAVVAAIAAVAVLDTWWAVALAVTLALVLLALTAVDVFRHLNQFDNRRGADTLAADGERGPDAAHRVLLVSSGPIDRRVTDEVLAGNDPDDVGVLVVVPTLADGPVRFILGDAREAVPDARFIVEQALDVLQAAGIRAAGRVGAADPAVALADGLGTYAADLVVVARHPAGDMRHLEGEPVERAAANAGVPLLEIDLSRSGSVRVGA